MRAIVFLSAIALASAVEPRLEQQGNCLVDSAEAISDLMDSSMFIWASVARCGHKGELIKCEINVASAMRSVNSMINVILKALDQCGDLQTAHKQCGLAASTLTKATAGLTAASGGIVQKCFDGKAHGNNWNHQEPAMCVVDIKNTAKSLFKVIKAFLKLKDNCNDKDSRACASNSLKIVAAFAGMGEYLAGAIGQCSPNGMKHARCAQESQRLTQEMLKVAQTGLDLSKACEEVPEPAAPVITTPGVQLLAPARLYAKDNGPKGQAASALSTNFLLAAFLPVTAIVSFVGGRFYANRGSSMEQARDFMSDHE
jgi:hypothetical protein